MVFLYIKNFNYFKHFFHFVDKDWLIMFHFCSSVLISRFPLGTKTYYFILSLHHSCWNTILHSICLASMHFSMESSTLSFQINHFLIVQHILIMCPTISTSVQTSQFCHTFFCIFSFMVYLILFSPIGLSGLSLMLLGSCTSPCCQGPGCWNIRQHWYQIR